MRIYLDKKAMDSLDGLKKKLAQVNPYLRPSRTVLVGEALQYFERNISQPEITQLAETLLDRRASLQTLMGRVSDTASALDDISLAKLKKQMERLMHGIQKEKSSSEDSGDRSGEMV